jgi:hypothetical protein
MKPINNKTLYIVHAIDVEGPMTETLEATFERMRAYGLPEHIAVNNKNLELIQEGRLEGIAPELAGTLKKVFNKRALAYLTDWEQIDSMIRKVTSASFRQKFTSGDGTPYVFSWFIYDHHHGFTSNPRLHEVGTHKIFDHYMNGLLDPKSSGDGIYWHYQTPAGQTGTLMKRSSQEGSLNETGTSVYSEPDCTLKGMTFHTGWKCSSLLISVPGTIKITSPIPRALILTGGAVPRNGAAGIPTGTTTVKRVR